MYASYLPTYVHPILQKLYLAAAVTLQILVNSVSLQYIQLLSTL